MAIQLVKIEMQFEGFFFFSMVYIFIYFQFLAVLGLVAAHGISLAVMSRGHFTAPDPSHAI